LDLLFIVRSEFKSSASRGSYACEVTFAYAKVFIKVLYLTLEAAIPCRSQPNVWKDSLKKRHNEILSQCDKVTLLQENYTSDCMIKRNRYMVDKSDYVAAVWNGKPSGTGNTIEYALKRNKPVYCIDAITFKMRKI
jgi:uncharacterized phage-like protein YoqJ